MDLNLNDKVVILSGAGGVKGSIGESMVQAIAKEDAIPVIVDINPRGLDYEKELKAVGKEALFIQADVTKSKQVEAVIEKVIEKYGKIDVLINNVGVNDGVSLAHSYEDFMNSLQLNLGSFFLMTKYAFPHLKKTKGNVLNIGSKVAMTGQGNTSGYAAAKGGVLALTREWAIDFVPFGMRCNAILLAECWTPSYDEWIKTLENGEEKLKSIVEKIPLEKRMTTPTEVANTALFLISDLASHTTGQHVFVDGGYVHLDRAMLGG